MDELKLSLSVSIVDIICITKTHLSEEITVAELQIEGYSFHRGDRKISLHTEVINEDISEGRGSIIYFRNHINAQRNLIFENAPDSVEIDMKTKFGIICIACVYRSTSLSENLNSQLIDCISSIYKETNDYATILTGDFNLPDVSWENGNVIGVLSSENKFLNLQLDYLTLFTEKGMNWSLTNEVTRRRMVNGALQESLLDQILFTNNALVSGFKILSPLGKSDHDRMTIDLGISFENYSNVNKEMVKSQFGPKFLLKKFLEFSRRNIDWNYSSEYLNVEDMWQELHGKLNSITSTAPKSTFDSSNRPLKLPWSTSRLKRMLRNKDKAWDTFDLNSTKKT